jgi:hypothetical protein
MACDLFKPVYAPQKLGGLNLAASAFGNRILYNIYFSTVRYDVIDEGVKYVSTDPTYLNTCIPDLPPGQMYFFIVRASEYAPGWYDPDQLQDGPDGLKIYTEGILLANISETDTVIPVSDIDLWPSYGIVQIGTEFIQYSSKDIPNNSLVVSERGFGETNIRFHNTDGYDGVDFRDPVVKFFKGYEDDNFRVQIETSGYATNSDKLTGDFDSSDRDLEDFPKYDQVGWHRTNPKKLVKGDCIGTYIGGEQWCADGYLGVGRQTRGVPLSEQALRREELLLESTGQPYVLVKRLWEGIRCPCVLVTNEQPSKRCAKCFGTGFSTGYDQHYSSRRSDGRILMRPGPYPDELKFYDAGLESEAILELWTLPVPSIKVKDFIIRYNKDGTEEFRYEIIQVTRNLLFDEVLGVQKIRAQRVRRTSPIYQWRAIASTATMPTKATTSIGMLRGPGGSMIPHTHEIVINEGIVSLSQVNQTTSVVEGHNHEVRDGVVQEEFGHTHTIIL